MKNERCKESSKVNEISEGEGRKTKGRRKEISGKRKTKEAVG